MNNGINEYLDAIKESINNDEDRIPVHLERGKLIMYSSEELLELLHNIDSMSEENVYNLLSKEYPIIFEQIFRAKDKSFNFLLESQKFLTIMAQVVIAHPVKYDDLVHLNAFIYNYLVYKDETKENQYLRHLLFMLGEALNKRPVRYLLGCDLDNRLAIFLAISLRSSFNQMENIRRFNFSLATAVPHIITVKKALDIYEAMFDKVTDLIVGTLFDTSIPANYDSGWVTPEIKQADMNITTAILTILESMVPYEITKVLYSIANEFKWKGCKQGLCKISFDNLNRNKYVKTCILIDQLKGEGVIFT